MDLKPNNSSTQSSSVGSPVSSPISPDEFGFEEFTQQVPILKLSLNAKVGDYELIWRIMLTFKIGTNFKIFLSIYQYINMY